jgi:hypothetical protein
MSSDRTFYLRIKGLSEEEVKLAYSLSEHTVGIVENGDLVGFALAETPENIIEIVRKFNE